MDIRIGNDIRLSTKLSDMNGYTANQIKSVCAMFINLSPVDEKVRCGSFPQSYNPSKYTIHGCGMPTYNVFPHKHEESRCAQSHGFCVYCDCGAPRFNKDGDTIFIYFPAEHQKHTGLYKVVVEVSVESEDLEDGKRTFTIDYGPLFGLSTKCNTATGIIDIELTKAFGPDLFVTTMTDEQLSAFGTNYVQLALDSQKYNLNALHQNRVIVHPTGTDHRIIFISNNSKLVMKYSIFEFPMKIRTVDNKLFIYVSEYKYNPQDIAITVIDGNEHKYPIETVDPDQPDDPSHETRPDPFPDTDPTETASLANNKLITPFTLANKTLITHSTSLSNTKLIL